MEFRGFSLYISIIIATIVNFDPFWSLRFLVKMVKISIDHKKIRDVMEQNDFDIRNPHTKITQKNDIS